MVNYDKNYMERLEAKGCSEELKTMVIKYAIDERRNRDNINTVIGAEFESNRAIGHNKAAITKLVSRLKSKLETLGSIGSKRPECPYPIGNCAEVDASNKVLCRQSSIQLKDIIFSEAIRPRTMGLIPTCQNCIDTFN